MVNGKHVFIAAIVLALTFIGFLVVNGGNQTPPGGNQGNCGPQGCSGADMQVGDSNIKEFAITAKKYSFDPSTITVNKGDRVKLTLKNADVSHGLAISEFGVDLKAGAGEQKTVEFLADKSGTFNMFCSVYCGEGHPEMSGKFIVKESITPQESKPSGEIQVIKLRGTPYGYDKSKLEVRAGTPVRLDFSADPQAGCGRQVIVDNVGVNLVSRNGETVSATFTLPSPGVYRYHCTMNMFRGELLAV